MFFRDYEKVLRANRPNISITELKKLAQQNWEAMEASGKQRYIDENSRMKEEYDQYLNELEIQSGRKIVYFL